MMRDAEQTIGNLVDKQKIAYLSSIDENGFPKTRAMLAPRVRKGIHTFYFTTNTSSIKVKEFTNNPKACIYFSDNRFYRGVTLTGTIKVLSDLESKKMIWQPSDVMYYKEGVDDPDYSVLEFTATSGEFYSNFKIEQFEIKK